MHWVWVMDSMLTAVGNDFNGANVGHVYIITFAAQTHVTLQPALVGCQPIQPEAAAEPS